MQVSRPSGAELSEESSADARVRPTTASRDPVGAPRRPRKWDEGLDGGKRTTLKTTTSRDLEADFPLDKSSSNTQSGPQPGDAVSVGLKVELKVGDPVYFVSTGRALPSGDRLVYGLRGVIAGASFDRTLRVVVRFPGNENPVDCLVANLSTLSHAAPS